MKIALSAFVGLIIGFTLAICLQQMLDAYKRSHAKRTAAECVVISRALEAYRADHGQYPPLLKDLTPKYLQQLPSERYLVVMHGAHAAVIAVGSDGAAVEEGRVIAGGHH